MWFIFRRRKGGDSNVGFLCVSLDEICLAGARYCTNKKKNPQKAHRQASRYYQCPMKGAGFSMGRLAATKTPVRVLLRRESNSGSPTSCCGL